MKGNEGVRNRILMIKLAKILVFIEFVRALKNK